MIPKWDRMSSHPHEFIDCNTARALNSLCDAITSQTENDDDPESLQDYLWALNEYIWLLTHSDSVEDGTSDVKNVMVGIIQRMEGKEGVTSWFPSEK